MDGPFAWTIGGPQGSGVDTAANLFARSCAIAGYYVFGKREYYSNIMGKHSYFQVRLHPAEPVLASTNFTHLLATFDAETPMKHFRLILEGGGLIYDPKLLPTRVDSLPNMEKRYKEELKAYLMGKGLGDTLKDIMKDAENSGMHLYPLPYEELYKILGDQLGISDFARLSRTQNTMAVAASMAIIKFPMQYLEKVIQEQFAGRPKLIDMNLRAIKIVSDYMKQTYADGFPYKIEPVKGTPEVRIYLQGTQAIALGKMYAGLGFQSYYPISPATDESTFLETHENYRMNTDRAGSPQCPTQGMVIFQTEDEIAAITSATGAAIAGARASTATSGPGFCLMVEGLGWAGINEVPLVVTLYQRGGPSTGLPTRTEQGDLWFAIHHGHSEFPRIVLASGDHTECFYDAVHAFNLAERYQVPVIHLVDKYLANSTSTIPMLNHDELRIERGEFLSDEELSKIPADETFRRFALNERGISPRTRPGQPGGVHWMTGDEHDELGHITEDKVIRMEQMEKRMRKLKTILDETPETLKLWHFETPGAKCLILSWGSNKGAILEAIKILEKRGILLSFLQLKMLWPLDAEALKPILMSYPEIIDVEQNYSGQMADLVQQTTHMAIHRRITKYNGRPVMVGELVDAIEAMLRNKNLNKVVLNYGV